MRLARGHPSYNTPVWLPPRWVSAAFRRGRIRPVQFVAQEEEKYEYSLCMGCLSAIIDENGPVERPRRTPRLGWDPWWAVALYALPSRGTQGHISLVRRGIATSCDGPIIHIKIERGFKVIHPIRQSKSCCSQPAVLTQSVVQVRRFGESGVRTPSSLAEVTGSPTDSRSRSRSRSPMPEPATAPGRPPPAPAQQAPLPAGQISRAPAAQVPLPPINL